MEYVRDMGWKRDPVIARARRGLAEFYRGVRRDKPELARLLFARERAAVRRMKRDIATNLFGLDSPS